MYAKQNQLYQKSPKFNRVLNIYLNFTYPKIQPIIINTYRFIYFKRNYTKYTAASVPLPVNTKLTVTTKFFESY